MLNVIVYFDAWASRQILRITNDVGTLDMF